ncbi:hypothetical protein Cgig2_031661 [Carnegiea gigantea]|uniref:Prefoldin subunit 2 n=1 Tax=Carnegiea gigantea TaxID=171969 RepID=A0A9Q1KQL7_9CARY|nr:hypothetical protein Cgig2_031661 [Carnegiea gigantea]
MSVAAIGRQLYQFTSSAAPLLSHSPSHQFTSCSPPLLTLLQSSFFVLQASADTVGTQPLTSSPPPLLVIACPVRQSPECESCQRPAPAKSPLALKPEVAATFGSISEPAHRCFELLLSSCTMQVKSREKMASRQEAERREPINEQAVANMYASMRSELNQIYSKITELEMEVSEHSLVINAIKPLDPSRRCYRMIGGVLVERTIKEVLPAVERNKQGIEEVIARLNEALEKKKKEISEFESKYKIRIKKTDNDVKDDSSKKEGSAQGVLVGPAGGSES